MNRVVSFLLAASLFFGSAHLDASPLKQFFFGPEKYNFSEIIVLAIPKNQLVHEFKEVTRSATPNGLTLRELIPPNESLENWSKMLTIQFLDKKLLPSSDLRNNLKLLYMQAKEKYQGLVWNVIEQSPETSTYEWACPYGFRSIPAQYEIVRLIMTKKGLHRAAITKKSPFSDSERQLWLQRLGEAHIFNWEALSETEKQEWLQKHPS
jgi:hypothetical protein